MVYLHEDHRRVCVERLPLGGSIPADLASSGGGRSEIGWCMGHEGGGGGGGGLKIERGLPLVSGLVGEEL